MNDPRPISLRGYEMSYREFRAEAPKHTFVLIHGIGVSMRYFLAFAQELARVADVYVLDLPGFGDTSKPAHGVSIAQYAELVGDFIAQQSLTRPLLIGHSMGCQIAIELLGRRPESAAGAVLLGPVVNPRERTGWQQAVRLLQDGLYERPRTNWYVMSDYARCGIGWYLTILPHMLEYRIEERISEVRLPLLIVRGEKDPIVPRVWTEQLAATASRATTSEIAGSGHGAMCNVPVRVAQICLEFARNV